jgi:hypothetical protein
MNRPLATHPAVRAQAALLRALAPLLGSHRPLAANSRDWASATFEGARHRLAFMLEGRNAADRATLLQATLADTELSISGGLVADITVVARLEGEATIVAIEALTIAEADWTPATDGLSRGAGQAG